MDHHHPSSRFPPQPPSYQQAHDRHDPRLHAVSTTYAASATGVGPPPMAYPYPPQAPYHAPDHRRELGPPGPPEGPPPQLGRYGEAASRHSRTSVAMLSPPYPARDARDENRLPRRNSYNFAPTHNGKGFVVQTQTSALEMACNGKRALPVSLDMFIDARITVGSFIFSLFVSCLVYLARFVSILIATLLLFKLLAHGGEAC